MQVHKFHLAGAGVSGVGIVSVIATIVAFAGKSSTCLEQSWPASWPGASVLMVIAAVSAALGPFLTALAPALFGGGAGSSGGGSASPPGSDGVGPTVASDATKVSIRRTMGARLLGPALAAFTILLAAPCIGCLPNTPIVPVTPANQAAISSCQNDSNWHNAMIVTGVVMGAVGTGAGIVAASDSDPTVKNAMGITGASSAAVAGGAAGVMALTNQLYTNGGCTQLTGPLPTLGKDGRPVASNGAVQVRRVVLIPSFNEASIEAEHTDVERGDR